jgi:putative ABC transport system ATP-binding protein
MSKYVSRLDSGTKVFENGSESVAAVKGANLSVSAGETVGIVGPSGSGKTTLLTLMGILQPPTGGNVYFEERDVGGLSAGEKRRLRLTRVGFIFQQLRLIPTLSVKENVELPMVLASAPASKRTEKARELVVSVGLEGKEGRKPSQLSVGEQQRVAVARALANDPVLILADEPTSQLDSTTGMRVVELLISLRARTNAAIVISTHDSAVCEKLDRVHSIKDGRLERDSQ